MELRNGGGSDALTHGVLGRRLAQGATTDLAQSGHRGLAFCY